MSIFDKWGIGPWTAILSFLVPISGVLWGLWDIAKRRDRGVAMLVLGILGSIFWTLILR